MVADTALFALHVADDVQPRSATEGASIFIFNHQYGRSKCNISNVRITVVNPETQHVIEDQQLHFIFIRQVSLPVDFQYFATY